MARPLTLHEALIRKSLETYRFQDGPVSGSWAGGGYECESISLTEEEAAEVDRIQTLLLCRTCHQVIDEGERFLTLRRHPWGTYCEEHGEVVLRG